MIQGQDTTERILEHRADAETPLCTTEPSRWGRNQLNANGSALPWPAQHRVVPRHVLAPPVPSAGKETQGGQLVRHPTPPRSVVGRFVEVPTLISYPRNFGESGG